MPPTIRRTNKRCPRCGETKPTSEFWSGHARSADGLWPHCAPCTVASQCAGQAALKRRRGRRRDDLESAAAKAVAAHDGPCRVPLRNRRGEVVAHALVDAADYPRIAKWRWHRNASGYARRGDPSGTQVLMHREVMEATPSESRQVDHISGDRLDNRRMNLRMATAGENRQNQKGRRNRRSRYRGVSWSNGRWCARVQFEGIDHRLGYFDDEDQAGAAAAAKRLELMPFATG